jgi:hypothetical protein
MAENPASHALDAIHDEATKLLNQNPPKSIEAGLRLIISLARYQHDVRINAEKDAVPGSGSAVEPEDNLTLTEAYDELVNWTRSLLRVVEENRAEIEEILTGASELPSGCPSHGSLAELAFRGVHGKLVEVNGFVKIVRRKILNGGKP